MPKMVDLRFLWVFVGLLTLAFRVSDSQNRTCNPDDLEALEGFVKSLDLGSIDGWGGFNSSSSSSSSDCCDWGGVHCELGRVVGLDLANKSLRGSVSESLAVLNRLRFLNLSSNYLHGAVPQKLFALPSLEVLDLSSNRLSDGFPATIQLPSMRVFNISSNMFNGSHPILSGSMNLTAYIVGFNLFSGGIDTSICVASPRLQFVVFSINMLSGGFPSGFGNCSSLKQLCVDSNKLSGELPDDLFTLSSLTHLSVQDNSITGTLSDRIGNLSSLVQLDLSANRISGTIPDVFGKMRGLQFLSFQSNNFSGPLPRSLSMLHSIDFLSMRDNSLNGLIDLNFTSMGQLCSLDLGSNQFTGLIPDGISTCVGLKTLNLARNNLHGEIPESFASLQSLSYLSLSNNSFTNISSALAVLQQCKNLTSVVLTMNFRGEVMPLDGVEGFTNLEAFIIANCQLSGSIPPWLRGCAKLQLVDLSWNHLKGTVPSWFGNLEELFYLDLSNNSLVGDIPKSLTQLKCLISHNNSLQRSPPPDFPFFTKRNKGAKGLQYNQVQSFPPSIDLSDNHIDGPIWPEFGNLKNIIVLDLSGNNLSGTIPGELSGMKSLENLDLSHNNLTGTIPPSLTSLNFLSSFSVAYNNLYGLIPSGGQFLTFSNSSFEGNKGLCREHSSTCPNQRAPSLASGDTIQKKKNKVAIAGIAIGILSGTAFILALAYIFVTRIFARRRTNVEDEEADDDKHVEMSGSCMVLLFNKDSKELTVDDLLKSTDNFDQANIIGCGGFGLVYKATLPDGRRAAIKRLSGDCGQMDREFQAEVQTLSQAQHENLVLLQGYSKIGNDRLLIYSYMANGSLDYWLHEKFDGGSTLDWDTRLRIAQGAARGLAYLHQSCQPHILHRDIKSSNILLDENFEAHLADFGLARLISAYDTHVSTDLVGTLGYIPPEYGQSSVATFKGDVYSFGVVLLELLTGRRPMDVCKPKECRDLISWVFKLKQEKRAAEVFDPLIYDKEHDKELMWVLEISCQCLNESPKVRPTTQQIVSWLDSITLNEQSMK
ncbi:Phytosulfokine receptor 1 [Acorus calamus]|uniref:non-specific serine/threonine protein kinase n=1 Tax=Acorus calamus TaxID=4465 RepID=A0AAV9D3T1_ACOCL|nr:Phytosulfokine receptor 1 [Acorus calamus]